MALLELEDIHTYYGNIAALKGVSIKVEEGEIVTLIGSNGAGKSTTLRSISGLSPPRQGSIKFDGQEIAETAPQDIVRLGISQSPEGRHCFQRMTVRENLDLGACSSCSRGSRSASARRRARCRAVSSRCSRSGAR
jgi:branched-chain amino acid transport system ATP-binding protein